MASLSSSNRHTTWKDYYRRLLDRDAVDNGMVNELSRGYLKDDEKYLNAILEEPTNVLLVPSKSKGNVHCVHHCSACEDDTSGGQLVAGIHGVRFASPWVVIPIEKSTSPLRVPPKRRQSSIAIPSLQHFLSAESAAEFADLNGDEAPETEIDLLKELPNVHWLPPSLFIACVDTKSLPAEELGFRVLMEVKRNTPANNRNNQNNNEDDSEAQENDPHQNFKEVHQLLTT